MRVTFATAEFSPIATVGGLAAASAGLVDALRRSGIDVDVVLPPNERIGFDHELDRQRYHVLEHGIVVIQKEQRFN